MKEQEKQERKKYAKREEGKQQKMYSFRLDLKNWKWLLSKKNKGRYINDLIKKDIHDAIIDDEHTSDLDTLDDFRA